MDTTKYTILHDAAGVRIDGFGGAAFDTTRLATVLPTLSTETPPAGADKVIQHNAPGKWGQAAFVVDGLFAKAHYTYRFLDRSAPFAGTDRLVANWERAAALGLPVPAYRGVFAVRRDGEWLWSGILAEYLDGWRNLDKGSQADAALMRRAIGDLAGKGVRNRDMHCANVMTDGNGSYRVVDLDSLEFGLEPAAAEAAMEEFFAASLERED